MESRKAPPHSASEYRGQVKEGMDKNLWKSVRIGDQWMWVKYRSFAESYFPKKSQSETNMGIMNKDIKSKKKREVIECVLENFGDKGYYIDSIENDKHEITINITSQISKAEFSIRFYNSKSDYKKDGKLASMAGDINVGPKIYDYGKCKNLKWMLTERLKGEFLIQKYPYDVKFINKALDKFIKLYKTTGIEVHDLTGDNIFITDKGKVYIFRYDNSDISIKGKHERDAFIKLVLQRHMAEVIIPRLIYSITIETDKLSRYPNLWKENYYKYRNKMFGDIVDSVEEWLSREFNVVVDFIELIWKEDDFKEDRKMIFCLKNHDFLFIHKNEIRKMVLNRFIESAK